MSKSRVAQTQGPQKNTRDIPGGRPFRASTIGLVFLLLSLSHGLAALYAPIQDCDEVFNYWEPTHYLTHNHGFQTWEYAPQYAIRSWSHASLHAAVIATIQRLLPDLAKEELFWVLRGILGLVCSVCETSFFAAITRTMNERMAALYIIITLTSPGMYHASISYLPSSFAMYTAMLGAAAFMNWQGRIRTVQGIFWFGFGACLGWPFAVALSIPFLLEEVIWVWLGDLQSRSQFIKRVLFGTISAALALMLQVAVDSTFYRKVVTVPLNIVLYNVFSSKGPDLYGTEPWHFYLRNLALNFHVWLPLALLALPILAIQLLSGGRWTLKARGVTFLSPLYLWLTIFTLQPHKEERFMYPAYPFLILSAAYTLHSMLAFLGDTSGRSLVARIPVMLRLTAVLSFVVLTLILTTLRVAGTWTAFGAPLKVYRPLANITGGGGNVCLGKEWYRFPSHYLLPEGYHAKFLKSEFNGLLPGEFEVGLTNDSAWYAGASVTPKGMNDENLEDIGKYVDITQCDFLVDSHLPSTITTSFEPDFIQHNDWEAILCVPFLDAASTTAIPRLFWTPNLAALPRSLQRVWGEYCLLKRKSNQKN